MFKLKTTAHFDSAHFLSGYNGKCSNIHGHRWKIEAVMASNKVIENGDKKGMLMDFSDFKSALKKLADEYDHTLIYETNTLKESLKKELESENFKLTEVPFRPTAENFSEFFFYELKNSGLPIESVTVYETPENCAIFTEDNE